MDKRVERRIISALRKIWYYSPERNLVRKKAREGKQYRCAKCHQLFDKVQIDHIEPVGTTKLKDGRFDYNLYIERLFCPPDNLQALCAEHHLEKTKDEQKKRLSTKKRSRQKTK